MLSSEELTAWYERLNLSAETRLLIERIRSLQPARRVGGGRGNVSGRYPSRKMGVTIQFESHRVELAFIYQMEHDKNVLELCGGQIYVMASAGQTCDSLTRWIGQHII